MTVPAARRAIVAALLALGVAAGSLVGSMPSGTATATAPVAAPLPVVWVTAPDRSMLLAHPSSTSASPAVTLIADGSRRFQTWKGAGGALTDAATQLLTPLGAPLRRQLFDPAAESGARLNLVRLPLSATDFSTRGWTWQDSPDVAPRPSVEALAAMRYLGQVRDLRGDMGVLTAAWSAPAWMKTSGSLNGGALDSAYLSDYSRLLLAQVRRLKAGGIPVFATTLGNEPFHSAPSYPTMTMSGEQMRQLAVATAEPLARQGVDLWALDHNWDLRDHVDDVLVGHEGRRFSAVAFHCYGSEHSERATSLQRSWAVTECTGGDWDTNWTSTFAWQARHLLVDPARRGSTALLLFNLALDPAHGPHLGGCSNCRGIVTVDPQTRTWSANPEYYLLAQVTRAVDPGGRRIGLTAVGDLPAVAFANPDGTVGFFGINTGAARVVRLVAGSESVRFSVGSGNLWSARLPGGSLAPEVSHSGHLVQWDGDRAVPKTTWYVAPDGRRLWVPDGSTYECLRASGSPGPRALSAEALDQLFDQSGLSAPCGDSMAEHRTLRRGMSLRSADGSGRITLEHEGALVLRMNGAPTWSNHVSADFVTLQPDGNLVAYTDIGTRVWHSATAGKGADRLVVTSTGKLRLMAGTRIVWTRG